jgi:uncharacterized membrane protein
MGYDIHGRYWGMHHGANWAEWLMMGILFLVCVGVLVGMILVLVRGQGVGTVAGVRQGRPAQEGTAEKTLDDRLALGEIDVAEYRERKSALLGSP